MAEDFNFQIDAGAGDLDPILKKYVEREVRKGIEAIVAKVKVRGSITITPPGAEVEQPAST